MDLDKFFFQLGQNFNTNLYVLADWRFVVYQFSGQNFWLSAKEGCVRGT